MIISASRILRHLVEQVFRNPKPRASKIFPTKGNCQIRRSRRRPAQSFLGVLLLRRIGEDAAERQGGDKQRTEDAFQWSPILRLADAGSGSCLRAAEPFVETDAA